MPARYLDPEAAEWLFASLLEAMPRAGQPRPRRELPGEKQPGDRQLGVDEPGGRLPPLYLSVLLYRFRKTGRPLDPAAQRGLERLCAYAWRSIHNAERVQGGRFLCPEDMVQDIYLAWRELTGPQPEEQALAKLLENDSREMGLLRVAVQRVIARTHYQQARWRRTVGGPPAVAKPGGQEGIDWKDFWESVVGRLTPREKQILELRKQEKTFAEIGAELGMSKQRVCELFHDVVTRLQNDYPSLRAGLS
jgi:hypothetical protein